MFDVHIDIFLKGKIMKLRKSSNKHSRFFSVLEHVQHQALKNWLNREVKNAHRILLNVRLRIYSFPDNLIICIYMLFFDIMFYHTILYI
jgi:hypothetical protein